MEPTPGNWLTRHKEAVKTWGWTRVLRTIFRLKARHLHIESGVAYGHANGQDLKLDLAMPRSGGPFPAVVTIPGGAWEWIAQPDSMLVLNEMLAEHGFVAADITYRLAPKDKFPAQIEDCKAAVRWLRANAEKYRIDPDRIGTLGFSSGGHLACLLGVTQPADGMEGNSGNPGQSSRVDAVVSFFGPTDFTLPSWRARYDSRLMASVLGTTYAEHPEAYERASPVHYVRPDSAPHLFFHGTADEYVSIEHSRVLAAKLKAAGVAVRLVEMPGLGHGGWPRRKFQECLGEAAQFLHEHLKQRTV